MDALARDRMLALAGIVTPRVEYRTEVVEADAEEIEDADELDEEADGEDVEDESDEDFEDEEDESDEDEDDLEEDDEPEVDEEVDDVEPSRSAVDRDRLIRLLPPLELRLRQSDNTGSGGSGSGTPQAAQDQSKHPHVASGPKGGQFTSHVGGGSKSAPKAKAAPAASVPQPPATPRTMKPGDSGEDVRYAQYAMSLLGFHVNQNGSYDAQTAAAVKEIQSRLGMAKPNGHLSAAQLHKLQDAVRLSPCVGQSRSFGQDLGETRDLDDAETRHRELALLGIPVIPLPPDNDNTIDGDTRTILDALDEWVDRQFEDDWDERAHDVAKELRIPGGKGGGRWTANPVGKAISDALDAWGKGKGPDDPFTFDGKPIDREPLRRAAVARGITLKRGASRDDIVHALLGGVRDEVKTARAERQKRLGSAKFSIDGPDGKKIDVAVYRADSKPDAPILREINSANRPGRAVTTQPDLAGLEKWANDNGHTDVAEWAKSERARAEAKSAPKAPAKKATAAAPKASGNPHYMPPASVSDADQARAAKLIAADPQIHATVHDRFGGISTSGNLEPADAAWLQSLYEREPAFVNRLAQDEQIKRYLERNAKRADETPVAYRQRAAARLKELLADKPIVTRVPDEAALVGILDGGRFRTSSERGTKRAPGLAISPGRKLGEEILGVPRDTPPEQRPIYGYVAVGGLEPALSPGKKIPGIAQREGQEDVLSTYGQVQVVLKPEVRARTTATVGDSLDEIGFMRPSPVDSPSAESLGIHNLDEIGSPGWTRRAYVEAQVHGGVSSSDIDHVVFPSEPSPAVVAKLEEHGIGWQVLDANGVSKTPAKKAATKAAKSAPKAAAPAMPAATGGARPKAGSGAAASGPAALTAGQLDLSGARKVPGVTEAERKAADLYANDAQRINNLIREGRTDSATIRNLDSLLGRSSVGSDVELWRGLRSGDGVFGRDPAGDLTGAEFTEPGYLSTSANSRVAEQFAGSFGDPAPVVMHLVAPAGTHAVTISDWGSGDAMGGQAEVLLQRGLRMRVVADHGVEPHPGIPQGVRRLDIELVPTEPSAIRSSAPGEPDGLDAEADVEDSEEAKAIRSRQLALLDTRALGHDVTPGHDELHHYWTRGPGLAKWAESPKPWTTLVAHLTKYVGPEKAKVFASRWFIELFHFAAGSDMNRVTHGKPPRGHVVGPG